jgi:signal recognition particle subunit SRP54
VLDALSEKFERILKKLRGQGVLTEDNIAEALKEVRLALLEADVNFKVVKEFLDRVREKAVGQEVLKSLTPGHQVVKVVWDELRGMMGGERSGISLASTPPTILMMVGLQGAGKTTTSGKLARLFKSQGKRERAVEMVAEGYHKLEVARQMGVSRATIARWVEKERAAA